MSSLSLQIAILVTTLLLNSLLMVVVFLNDHRNASNQSYAALALVINFWLISSYFSATPTTDLWWSRWTIFFATGVSYLLMVFLHTLPSKVFLIRKRWAVFFTTVTAVVMGVTLSPFAFMGIETVEDRLELIPGPGMGLFALVTTAYAAYALYHLTRKYRSAKGVKGRQLGFVWWGVITMLALVLLTVMLPALLSGSDIFVPFAPLYTLIFLSLTAYSLIRYRLFSVKVLMTEALVSLVVLILVFEALLASDPLRISYKLLFAVVVTYVGYLLVRSVKREVEQRLELSRLAKRLEKVNDDLQSLDRLKTEFLSLATHQMRTPMSVIKGYVALLLDGAYGPLAKDMKPVLEHINGANEQFIRLIGEFLDISQIEQGKIQYAFEEVNPKQILNAVVKELEPRIKEKGLHLKRQAFPKEDLLIMADQDKIRHVMFNFLDNAIRYTPQGEIQLSLSLVDGGIQYEVKDSGIGFTREDAKGFFQKFYRGENVKRKIVDGTGLGLFMAKSFIEKHEGRVWAQSDGLGKGAVFAFWLPLLSK